MHKEIFGVHERSHRNEKKKRAEKFFVLNDSIGFLKLESRRVEGKRRSGLEKRETKKFSGNFQFVCARNRRKKQ